MKKSQISAVMRELNARRNKKLSAKQRSAIARKAANERWNPFNKNFVPK